MNGILQIISSIALSVSLGAIFYRWNYIKNTTQRFFLYYLIYVLLNEFTAKILTYNDFGNYALYNVYDIITYSFLLGWFYKILKHKKLVIGLALVFYIGVIVSFFVSEFMTAFVDINVYIGTSIVLILVISYYASLLQLKDAINYSQLPAFWITTGLLIFHIGYLPIQFLLSFEDFDVTGIYAVISILNILQYGCFTKGFLCYQKKAI
mgnify:CR=1 FL=1